MEIGLESEVLTEISLQSFAMTIEGLTTKLGNPLGLGTGSGTVWKKQDRSDESAKQVSETLLNQLKLALELGFRHIDSAEAYKTHLEVGLAVKESGIPREDLFITTKFSPYLSFFVKKSETPAEFVDEALDELQLEYLDLVLFHHPLFKESKITIEEGWLQLIETVKQGKVRYIGVSNTDSEVLDRLIAVSKAEGSHIYPRINQIEFHPYNQAQSPGILEYAANNNIILEAYGPLTPLKLKSHDSHPLEKIIPELALKYDKTEAQILLRYTLQKGLVPITTSSKKERILESLDVFDFELDPQDVATIDTEGSKLNFKTIDILKFK